jgi:hypothetical protein
MNSTGSEKVLMTSCYKHFNDPLDFVKNVELDWLSNYEIFKKDSVPYGDC